MSLTAARSIGRMDPEWMRQASLPYQQTMLFTRHLGILFGAGVPLAQCLEVLSEQADHPVLAEVLWSISHDLHSGSTLSHACSRFPKVFDATYVSVLKVAEQTGHLQVSLDNLAQWQERDQAQRQQIRSALTYPVVVLAVTALLSLWLCYAILPSILAGMQGSSDLPLPTRALMFFVQTIRQPLGVALIIGMLVGTAGTGYSLWRRPPEALRMKVWWALLRAPLLGPALRDSCIIRYCAAWQVLLRGGTDVMRSLRLAARASGNPYLLEDQWRLRQAIEDATPISEAMSQQRWLYGGLLPSLVAAGEETGLMEPSFRRTREFLEEDVAYRFQMVQQALEPILLLVLACVVLFFLLAVLMPLYAQMQSL